MARDLTAAMKAELDALMNRPGHLFEAYFDDETVRATDFYCNLTWNGNTYVANGHFLQFDGVEESTETIIPQANIVLSGVDQAWIQKVLEKKFVNRRIVVRKASCDAAWNVVVDPGVLFDGFMKRPRIVEDSDSGKCHVLVECSHDAADFENAGGRRTNHELEQLHFPGDGIFKYASQGNRQLLWGAR